MKRVHRPLMWVALAMILGIVLEEQSSLRFSVIASCSSLGLLFSILISRRYISFIALMIVVIGLSAMYTKITLWESDDHINKEERFYRKQPVPLRGMISSEVTSKEFRRGYKTSFMFDINEVKAPWGWKKSQGRVLVNLFRQSDLQYGDVIEVKGRLHRPFEFGEDSNFSYRRHLRNYSVKHICSLKKSSTIDVIAREQGSWIKTKMIHFKKKWAKVFDEHLTENESGIIKAIILGERSHIPNHIRELFVRTGTAHILAISGLHIAVVGFVIFMFFQWWPISRRYVYVLTIISLVAYAILTGGRPSVVRATLMSAVFLLSLILERNRDSINSLSLAAVILLIINPLYLFDLGFQLSFASVLAILLFYPIIYFWMNRLPFDFDKSWVRLIGQSVSVSLAAELGVMGLVAYYFNIITPISLLANIPILFLITAVVVLGIGLMMTGLLIPAWAFCFALCLQGVLNVMVLTAFLMVHVPGAYVFIKNINHWHLIGYYILITSIYTSFLYLTKNINYDRVTQSQ